MLILKASALQMRMDRVPALKGEVDSKTTVFEDGGVFLA